MLKQIEYIRAISGVNTSSTDAATSSERNCWLRVFNLQLIIHLFDFLFLYEQNIYKGDLAYSNRLADLILLPKGLFLLVNK